MKCQTCGVENPAESRFCIECGKTVPAISVDQTMSATIPSSVADGASGGPAASSSSATAVAAVQTPPSFLKRIPLWGYLLAGVSGIIFCCFLGLLVVGAVSIIPALQKGASAQSPASGQPSAPGQPQSPTQPATGSPKAPPASAVPQSPGQSGPGSPQSSARPVQISPSGQPQPSQPGGAVGSAPIPPQAPAANSGGWQIKFAKDVSPQGELSGVTDVFSTKDPKIVQMTVWGNGQLPAGTQVDVNWLVGGQKIYTQPIKVDGDGGGYIFWVTAPPTGFPAAQIDVQVAVGGATTATSHFTIQ